MYMSMDYFTRKKLLPEVVISPTFIVCEIMAFAEWVSNIIIMQFALLELPIVVWLRFNGSYGSRLLFVPI